MFFTKEDQKEEISNNVDKYDDSFARDTSIAELTEVTFFIRVSLAPSDTKFPLDTTQDGCDIRYIWRRTTRHYV